MRNISQDVSFPITNSQLQDSFIRSTLIQSPGFVLLLVSWRRCIFHWVNIITWCFSEWKIRRLNISLDPRVMHLPWVKFLSASISLLPVGQPFFKTSDRHPLKTEQILFLVIAWTVAPAARWLRISQRFMNAFLTVSVVKTVYKYKAHLKVFKLLWPRT